MSTRRDALIARVMTYADKMLGTNYDQGDRMKIWPGGIMDCSSYVYAMWAAAGLPLLGERGNELITSYRQAEAVGFDCVWPGSHAQIGKKLPSPRGLLSSYGAQAGDIVFWNFKNTSRYNKITHVGMIYAGGKKIIHISNNKDKCCYKPFSYGDTEICGIIRLREDFVYPKLPDIQRPDAEHTRAETWQVRMLQAALNLRRGTKLNADGAFGSLTENAVVALNNTLGFASAVCDARTWAALGFVNNGDVPAPIPEPGGGEAQYLECVGGTVNVRMGPGTSHPPLIPGEYAVKGQKLLGVPAGNGWWEIGIYLDGKMRTGYISGKEEYVKVVGV